MIASLTGNRPLAVPGIGLRPPAETLRWYSPAQELRRYSPGEELKAHSPAAALKRAGLG